jgi:2-keto-4-pentenoate hydratase/2-oxohepta-3-ene-1,7-dioic acid hydratase in catechol pathway
LARVVVAGANYAKHLTEFGVPQVSAPFAFLKANGALIGAYEDIRYPPLTEKLDYEVELVAVLGSADIDLDHPYKSVLGWTVGNDVSARDLQRSGPAGIGMDLFAAKSQDRSTPVGPWVVTRDEFGPDATPACRMTTRVNGEVRQDANTADMTFKVDEIIRFVHQRSSFGPGDLLFTGTPDGVADGSGKFLKVGDVVEAEIETIGLLRNTVSKD